MMEIGSVAEGFLCPGAVLQENLIDTEILVIDPILLKCGCILVFHRFLEASHLLKEILPLLDGEVLYDTQRP
ncbi:hypothetical protein SDC9_51629 [bioreactor metagenome]|uniref:Uncharacterized protein n=1 Tax=bioreactor metagenome TaxID=1076179 RepID=A0A644WPB0_9ZZZZ